MFRAISCLSSGDQIVLIQPITYNFSQWPTWCTIFKYIYYNPLDVSSNILLILRRSNCINTASGIVTVSKWPFGAQVCTGRSLIDSDDTRCCVNTICPPEDEQDIARNMYMYRTVINVLKICASSWSLAKVIIYFVCDWRDNLQWARSSSFTRFLDHTRRRTTVGRAPLEENITLLCLHNISVTSSWHYSALTVTHTIWELCEHEYVDRV